MVHRPRTDVVFEMNGRWMASSSGAETPRALTGERLLVLDAGLALLVVVGVWLLRFGPVGVALLAVALLGVAVQWLLRRKEANWVPLGSKLALRALIVAGCAVAVVRLAPGRPGQALWAALAVILLIAALALETVLVRAARFKVPMVSNLPGVPAPRRSRDDTRPAAYASATATAIGLVLAATAAPALWWFVVAVVAMVPYLLLGLDGRAKILATRRLRTDIPAAVAAYAPEFVVYTSRPDDASYQVMMWLPHLQADRPAVPDRHPERRAGGGAGRADRRSRRRGPADRRSGGARWCRRCGRRSTRTRRRATAPSSATST